MKGSKFDNNINLTCLISTNLRVKLSLTKFISWLFYADKPI